MKKILLTLLSIAFILGVVSNAYAKEFKIVFADKLKILFEYDKAKKLNEELERENQKAKEEFDKKAQEIRKLRDEMELLSESARKKKASELEKNLIELDEFRKNKQQEIGKKYDEGIREVSKEISDICEKYGKAKGYDAIIDARATVYLPDSLDVTDDIIKELNK